MELVISYWLLVVAGCRWQIMLFYAPRTTQFAMYQGRATTLRLFASRSLKRLLQFVGGELDHGGAAVGTGAGRLALF
jgi:hypothetical protein